MASRTKFFRRLFLYKVEKIFKNRREILASSMVSGETEVKERAGLNSLNIRSEI